MIETGCCRLKNPDIVPRQEISREEIQQEKSRLRKLALARRAALGRELRRKASARAVSNFADGVELPEKSTIALYWPMGDELDCLGLIEKMEQMGHEVCLPCIAGNDRPMIFRKFEGEDRLVAAAFGTREPDERSRLLVPDLIVLPLLAFDRKGNRLGYGKGFYDRTIAGMEKRPILCGLAFGVQELENVPASFHDVPLEQVITENGGALEGRTGMIS